MWLFVYFGKFLNGIAAFVPGVSYAVLRGNAYIKIVTHYNKGNIVLCSQIFENVGGEYAAVEIILIDFYGLAVVAIIVGYGQFAFSDIYSGVTAWNVYDIIAVKLYNNIGIWTYIYSISFAQINIDAFQNYMRWYAASYDNRMLCCSSRDFIYIVSRLWDI